MRNLDAARATWIRRRIALLCGLMAVGLGGIVSSAYQVQIEDGPAWREMAEKQRQRRLHLDPKRGTIYDRNGNVLAVSVDVPSVSADVAEMLRGIDDVAAQQVFLRDAATRIAQTLSLDANEVLRKLTNKPRFVWLKRQITGDESAQIRDLGDPKKQRQPLRGLAVEGEGHRYYPGRELAGAVLGFVAPDGQGKDGIELSMDEELRGHAEEVRGVRDRNGRLLFSEGVTDERAIAGHDVQLTLDIGIQHVVERELGAAQRTYETKGGALVVVDPNTGDILALASTPGYNPNDYKDSDVDARRDRAVSDRFEPGSVMKIFTVSGALAAGTLRPTDTIFCENGSFRVGSVTIHDTHPAEWLAPTQILAKSSNIGALKIGLSLGEQGLYSALRRFGFGEVTGLPLPGEASGVLRPRGRPWFEVETANAAFGQGISVTSVQLAMAMAAVANNGRLLEPVLVRKVTDARGATVREGTTRVRREVIPPGVARTLAQMLTAVAEEGGTGVEAAVSGYRVAGKTATAQKADPATGRYSVDKYTSSFVGFLPAERPRLVIAVVLDEPMIGKYGGDLAGPVFRRVAEESLRLLGVSPTHAAAKLSGVSRADDPGEATRQAFRAPAGALPLGGEPQATSAAAPQTGAVRVPDGTSMGARDAVRAFLGAGLVPQIEGTGRLTKQLPSAGTAVQRGATVRLYFEPAS